MKSTPFFLRAGGALAVAGLALLLGACTTRSVNSSEPAEPQARPAYVPDKRVITDQTLADKLRVTSINQTTVSDNLLKIQATVENVSTQARTYNYKFEWFDRDGMAINSPNETWKSLRLQGGETSTISTVAVSPKAVDFKLKFRE